MEDIPNQDNELAGDQKELDEEMEKLPTSERKTLSRLANMFKSTISGGFRKADQSRQAIKTVTLMAKAVRYSQDAQRMYWDLGTNTQKTKPELKRAYEIVDRGIKMLDECAISFPSAAAAVVPLKEKMLAQKKDIVLQMEGVIVDPDTLFPPKPVIADVPK